MTKINENAVPNERVEACEEGQVFGGLFVKWTCKKNGKYKWKIKRCRFCVQRWSKKQKSLVVGRRADHAGSIAGCVCVCVCQVSLMLIVIDGDDWPTNFSGYS